MFLEAERIPAIIRNMQEHTNPGGYNLIVCAMDTEDYPCQMPFSFTFKVGDMSIIRIGNWSNTMKILATSIVEMRMEIEFNFGFAPCWQKKNKKAEMLRSCLQIEDKVIKKLLLGDDVSELLQKFQT